jgi:hypothetical protein
MSRLLPKPLLCFMIPVYGFSSEFSQVYLYLAASPAIFKLAVGAGAPTRLLWLALPANDAAGY